MRKKDEIELLLNNLFENDTIEFQEKDWDNMEVLLNESTEFLIDEQKIATDKTIPYKEEYWDEMVVLFDKKEKRRKALFFMKFASIVFIVFTFSFLSFYQFNTFKCSIFENLTCLNSNYIKKIENVLNKKTFSSKTLKSDFLKERNFEIIKSTESNFSQIQEINSSVLSFDSSTQITQNENQIILEDDLLDIDILNSKKLNSFNRNIINDLKSRQEKKKWLFLKNMNLYTSTSLLLAIAPKGNSELKHNLGYGITSSFGLNYNFKKCVFQMGVDFNYRSGINHQLAYIKTIYGTRKYTETYKVDYKGLLRLQVPISVFYKHNRNLFGIGASPVFNIAAVSKYSYENSFNSNSFNYDNNIGIKEGIEKLDVNLNINYERYFTENFVLGFKVNLGLFNQIDTNKFQNTKGLKEYSGGLYVKYYLLN